MKRKTKKWIRFRHKVVTEIARLIMIPYIKLRFGITIEKFKEQNGRQYLVLLNHQTVFDQFFVGLAFKGPLYYLATEDIFSNGFVSTLIKYLVAPIPIKKQTTDVTAVKNCMRVAKEGGTIVLAPEGNRTYSGKTVYMNPAISALAKRLGLPVALFRIEGGYGIQPRWSDVIRKGKMRAYISEVIEPDEVKALSNDELYERIKTGLFVDEACLDNKFYHKKNAEYLERAIYVCHKCGLSTFESKNDIISCKKCGMQVRYTPTKELKGIGFDFPFNFVADWYEYQCDFINNLDVNKYIASPLYTDTARLSKVIVYKKKICLRPAANLSLYGDKIVIDETADNRMILPFDKISSVAVLGRNKLNIYFEDMLYQIKGDKRFNALKYVNIYHRHKNILGGGKDDKFLGL